MNILRESSKEDNYSKKEIIKKIQDIVFEFEGSEMFNELRVFINEEIKNQSLKDILLVLVDESESDNENSEMVLNILEAEVDSFFRY